METALRHTGLSCQQFRFKSDFISIDRQLLIFTNILPIIFPLIILIDFGKEYESLQGTIMFLIPLFFKIMIIDRNN